MTSPLPLPSHIAARIVQKLEEDHGIDAEEFQELQAYVGKSVQVGFAEDVFKMGERWTRMSPDGKNVQELPWLVLDNFEGDCSDKIKSYIPGDIRVYLVPADRGVPFLRLTLNNARATRRAFDEDGFVTALVEEWAGLAERLEGDDEEDDEDSVKKCAACGFDVWELMPVQPKPEGEPESEDEDEEEGPEAKHCSNCGAALVEVVAADVQQ